MNSDSNKLINSQKSNYFKIEKVEN